MVECPVTAMKMRFAASEGEVTELTINRQSEGIYSVDGWYQLRRNQDFPSLEVVHRTGGAFAETIDALYAKISSMCDKTWYHHYHDSERGRYWSYPKKDGSWSILIEADGKAKRWEGVGYAPKEIDTLYEDLLAFGMPALRPDYYCGKSFLCACATFSDDEADPRLLYWYEKTLTKLVQAHDHDAEATEYPTLLNEFIEDVTRYLTNYFPKAIEGGQEAQVWPNDGTVSSLCAVNVAKAGRADMMLLLGTFVRVCPTYGGVADLVRSGALTRWCDRIRKLPDEEQKERQRIKREKQRELAAQIDTTLSEYVATGAAFTSYDVAKACGVTAQQVSGRIRNLVRKGEVKALEGALPRKYRAA